MSSQTHNDPNARQVDTPGEGSLEAAIIETLIAAIKANRNGVAVRLRDALGLR